MTTWLRRRWVRSLLPAIAGFCAYGGWAYLANMSHGSQAAGTAAVVQGSYSFILTLSTTLVMERLYSAFHGQQQRVLKVIGATCLGLFLTAYGINWLANTPEILATILPGFLIGSAFTILYVRHLAAATDTG